MHALKVLSPLEQQYLWYLFLAYTAVWIIMFGFLFRMVHRAKKLEQEVRLLKQEWVTTGEERSPDQESPAVTPSLRGRGL